MSCTDIAVSHRPNLTSRAFYWVVRSIRSIFSAGWSGCTIRLFARRRNVLSTDGINHAFVMKACAARKAPAVVLRHAGPPQCRLRSQGRDLLRWPTTCLGKPARSSLSPMRPWPPRLDGYRAVVCQTCCNSPHGLGRRRSARRASARPFSEFRRTTAGRGIGAGSRAGRHLPTVPRMCTARRHAPRAPQSRVQSSAAPSECRVLSTGIHRGGSRSGRFPRLPTARRRASCRPVPGTNLPATKQPPLPICRPARSRIRALPRPCLYGPRSVDHTKCAGSAAVCAAWRRARAKADIMNQATMRSVTLMPLVIIRAAIGRPLVRAAGDRLSWDGLMVKLDCAVIASVVAWDRGRTVEPPFVVG